MIHSGFYEKTAGSFGVCSRSVSFRPLMTKPSSGFPPILSCFTAVELESGRNCGLPREREGSGVKMRGKMPGLSAVGG